MTIKKLLLAIGIIESALNPLAIGDNGKAIGQLQIHPEVVKDVNRLQSRKRYLLEDRKCPVKSEEIATVYLDHYGKAIGVKLDDSMSIDECVKLARLWNGGVKGNKRSSTLGYAEKVKNELVKIEYKPTSTANKRKV